MVELQASSAPMRNKDVMEVPSHRDNDKHEEGATADNMDPSRPVLILEKIDVAKMRESNRLRSAWLARSKPNDIIIPDPTPERVIDAFYRLTSRLGPILKKDNVPSFLRLFVEKEAVLEGKELELNGKHANPNCMNPFGYFPLHEAAEKFSVDMIKLLFLHGASANVRTIGDDVIEGLLPLHVAVENTCLHKYLEDNLFSPMKDHPDCMYNQDSIYKLITLLCLPEMKIFLDTVRLLAEKTDNLVDEVWTYIEDRKLVQTAILLLAAQKQFRGDCISGIYVYGKQSGLDIILQRLVNHSSTPEWKKDENADKQQQLEESITFNHPAFLLVRIISRAGKALDAYIQGYSEVPRVAHEEIIKHVSAILKESGFQPTDETIDVKSLRSYDCKIADGKLNDQEDVKANNQVKESAYLLAAEEKAVRKESPKGWDPGYRRRMFLPYWRSVLSARCRARVYPSYAPADSSKELDPERISGWIKSMSKEGRNAELASNHQFKRPFGTSAFTANRYSRVPNRNHCLSGKIQQPASNNQSRRIFGAAASTLLKVLKNA